MSKGPAYAEAGTFSTPCRGGVVADYVTTATSPRGRPRGAPASIDTSAVLRVAEADMAALQRALADATPLCAGNERFIAEDLEPVDLAEMTALCDLCPARFACSGYARATKPPAGFWAGKLYPRPTGRPRKDAA
jgi:hypothetical protein